MENKSLKYWKGFAIILIVLNITLMVLLLKPLCDMHRFHRDGGRPEKFIVEKLKFTGQQETAFDKLRTAHHDSIEILQEEGKKLRKTFFDGLKTDVADSTKLKMADKIATNQKQIELLTYNHFVEVKKLCTPEQKLIFNDIIQEIIGRLGKPPKGGPGERPE